MMPNSAAKCFRNSPAARSEKIFPGLVENIFRTPRTHSNATFLSGTPSVPDFYKPDELKYHGKKNRGVVTMNFYDVVKQSIGNAAGESLDFCGGEWKYPRACSVPDKTCDYFARWKFDENTDMIDFTVQSRHTDKWTGIGFSDTPQMVRY